MYHCFELHQKSPPWGSAAVKNPHPRQAKLIKIPTPTLSLITPLKGQTIHRCITFIALTNIICMVCYIETHPLVIVFENIILSKSNIKVSWFVYWTKNKHHSLNIFRYFPSSRKSIKKYHSTWWKWVPSWAPCSVKGWHYQIQSLVKYLQIYPTTRNVRASMDHKCSGTSMCLRFPGDSHAMWHRNSLMLSLYINFRFVVPIEFCFCYHRLITLDKHVDPDESIFCRYRSRLEYLVH